MNVTFFDTPAELRRWFAKHHASRSELWIGFHRKDSGLGGVTYREALDLALCYGWIDGVRRKVDDVSYTNRFTPRKPRSNWSTVNIKRVRELEKLGLMRAPGVKAFERRDEQSAAQRTGERRTAKLPPAMIQSFQASPRAWRFFQAQPPGYRRLAAWWVISAKRDATRSRRLEQLIEASHHEERVSVLQPGAKNSRTSPRRRPHK